MKGRTYNYVSVKVETYLLNLTFNLNALYLTFILFT